jgi:molecular chaperone GrpE
MTDDNDINTNNETEDNDDIVFDQDDSEDADPEEKIKKLKAKLKQALEEKQTYLNNWQRDKADFINAKKRDAEEKKDFIKFAEESLIAELIPVLDSFDMAMANKEAWEKADKNWRVGIEYIYSQLLNILTSHGLIKINPIGKPFDPNLYHSIAVIPTNKKEEDHIILEVTSYGYSLNEKVIKAPNVKVGEYKAEA